MDFPAQIINLASLTAKRLWSSTRGSIAQLAAVAVPALSLVSIATVELVAVSASGSRVQSIADAAALEGAQHLSLAVDPKAVKERTASFVEAQFAGWSDAPAYQATYEIVDWNGQNAIRVLLSGNRPSFFSSKLPEGGWKFRGEATAAPVGKTPLCVLTIGEGTHNMEIRDSSRLMAPDCGIHANANIVGGKEARIDSRRIQAKGKASGPIMTPAPGQDAAYIADPFRAMQVRSLTCPGGKVEAMIFNGGTHYLAPGTHCRPIIVKSRTTLVLLPGNHLFSTNVRLEANARLQGEDVFLHINTGSATPDFTADGARVNLVGRKSGPYAGMVMASVWSGQPVLTVPGENVERLLGVVYLRTGFLQVSGEGVAAEDSAWTVIVARRVISTGQAKIRINADYESSDVPVPNGVGPSGGLPGGEGTRLID